MTTASQIRGAVYSPTAHDSARNHVNGRSVFIDDMPAIAGTLHAALVKSTHAHATIISINKQSAKSLNILKFMKITKSWNSMEFVDFHEFYGDFVGFHENHNIFVKWTPLRPHG